VYKALFIIMLLLSCGPDYPYCPPTQEVDRPTAGLGIDPEFFQYVEAFEVAWRRQVTDTDIVFVDSLPNTVLAFAYSYSDPSQRHLIEVDRTKWNANPVGYREPLIFHELGHAVLGLDHVNTFDPDGCASSVMNAFLPPAAKCWDNKRMVYVDRLLAQPKR
jgi:hypothetical protein